MKTKKDSGNKLPQLLLPKQSHITNWFTKGVNSTVVNHVSTQNCDRNIVTATQGASFMKRTAVSFSQEEKGSVISDAAKTTLLSSIKVSPLSLETYIDIYKALVKETKSVQSISNVEETFFRISDLKNALAIHGLAAGDKKRRALLDEMVGMELTSPFLTATSTGSPSDQENEEAASATKDHKEGPPIGPEHLKALGWVSDTCWGSGPEPTPGSSEPEEGDGVSSFWAASRIVLEPLPSLAPSAVSSLRGTPPPPGVLDLGSSSPLVGESLSQVPGSNGFGVSSFTPMPEGHRMQRQRSVRFHPDVFSSADTPGGSDYLEDTQELAGNYALACTLMQQQELARSNATACTPMQQQAQQQEWNDCSLDAPSPWPTVTSHTANTHNRQQHIVIQNPLAQRDLNIPVQQQQVVSASLTEAEDTYNDTRHNMRLAQFAQLPAAAHLSQATTALTPREQGSTQLLQKSSIPAAAVLNTLGGVQTTMSTAMVARNLLVAASATAAAEPKKQGEATKKMSDPQTIPAWPKQGVKTRSPRGQTILGAPVGLPFAPSLGAPSDPPVGVLPGGHVGVAPGLFPGAHPGLHLGAPSGQRLGPSPGQYPNASPAPPLGANTDRHLVRNTDRHLCASTDRHLGASTDRHLGASTDRHLGASTDWHLGTNTDQHLDANTDRHLAANTGRRLAANTDRHLATSTGRRLGANTGRRLAAPLSVLRQGPARKKQRQGQVADVLTLSAGSPRPQGRFNMHSSQQGHQVSNTWGAGAAEPTLSSEHDIQGPWAGCHDDSEDLVEQELARGSEGLESQPVSTDLQPQLSRDPAAHFSWLAEQVINFSRDYKASSEAVGRPASLAGRRVAFALLQPFEHVDERNQVEVLEPGLYAGRITEYLGTSCQSDFCDPGCTGGHNMFYVKLPMRSTKTGRLELKLDLTQKARVMDFVSLIRLDAAALQDAWVLLQRGEEAQIWQQQPRVPVKNQRGHAKRV